MRILLLVDGAAYETPLGEEDRDARAKQPTNACRLRSRRHRVLRSPATIASPSIPPTCSIRSCLTHLCALTPGPCPAGAVMSMSALGGGVVGCGRKPATDVLPGSQLLAVESGGILGTTKTGFAGLGIPAGRG